MISIVQSSDWLGVYRDDKLVYEGHTISYDRLLTLAGVDFSITPLEMKYQDWFLTQHGNRMPLTLPEVHQTILLYYTEGL